MEADRLHRHAIFEGALHRCFRLVMRHALFDDAAQSRGELRAKLAHDIPILRCSCMIDAVEEGLRSLAIIAEIIEPLDRNRQCDQREDEQRIHDETAAVKKMNKVFHLSTTP